jgi:hypothetical protein
MKDCYPVMVLVLVGFRARKLEGKPLFHIKNWWDGHQYIKCDSDSLISRGAYLVWITATGRLVVLPAQHALHTHGEWSAPADPVLHRCVL